jgi:hypothetical protein
MRHSISDGRPVDRQRDIAPWKLINQNARGRT